MYLFDIESGRKLVALNMLMGVQKKIGAKSHSKLQTL
jgi:hypothetical protein